MSTETPKYAAYMLRLWQVDDGSHAVWRASLESPGTGERLGFASLDLLFAFLRDQAAAWTAPEEVGAGTTPGD